MQGVFSFLAILVVLAVSLLYFYTGVAGISIEFGRGWAIATAIIAGVFRFTLPLSVGAFFYASNIWGWGTLGSILFAFPFLGIQLLLLTGGVLATIADKVRPS